MRKLFLLATIIAFLAMGLYGQEKDTVQGESTVKLALVWEKEIAIRVKDWWPYMSNFVFLDEEGYNLFSSMSKGSTKAIENKRMLYIGEGKIQFLEGNELKQTKVIDLGNHPYHPFQVEISKNGRNIAVINRLDLDIPQEGAPAILRLFNSNGELLGEDTVGLPSDIYPLGNDKIVILEYGEWSHIEVYRRNGTQFDKVQEYDGYFLDYSEDGSYALISVDPHGKNERVIINKDGQEALRYHHDKKAWRGFISPKGNYIAEITRGKYIVIFDKRGNVISEHKVEGAGNYWAVFSADEQFFATTPGPQKIYFFRTTNGKIVWQYTDSDRQSLFQTLLILCERNLLFAGFSKFDPTYQSLTEYTTDKFVYLFDTTGKVIQKIGPFDSEGFYEQWSVVTPVVFTLKNELILVQVPGRLSVYKCNWK
ncbi:MAG: hypothetical protein ACUVQT_09555 [bacterium]